jgi:hypothetical protein
MKWFVISDFIVLCFLLIFYVILSDMYESQPDAIFVLRVFLSMFFAYCIIMLWYDCDMFYITVQWLQDK